MVHSCFPVIECQWMCSKWSNLPKMSSKSAQNLEIRRKKDRESMLIAARFGYSFMVFNGAQLIKSNTSEGFFKQNEISASFRETKL